MLEYAIIGVLSICAIIILYECYLFSNKKHQDSLTKEYVKKVTASDILKAQSEIAVDISKHAGLPMTAGKIKGIELKSEKERTDYDEQTIKAKYLKAVERARIKREGK